MKAKKEPIVPYKLTSENVHRIFQDSLFRDGEDTTGAIIVDGITVKVGFHPDRLQAHADEIRAMLMELPEGFRRSGGGGWSFLNACDDRHGRQWTGLHIVMSELFLLGEGVGLVKCMLPRELWSVLAGGVPYYEILD